MIFFFFLHILETVSNNRPIYIAFVKCKRIWGRNFEELKEEEKKKEIYFFTKHQFFLEFFDEFYRKIFQTIKK